MATTLPVSTLLRTVMFHRFGVFALVALQCARHQFCGAEGASSSSEDHSNREFGESSVVDSKVDKDFV